jgi:hypothetical protein
MRTELKRTTFFTKKEFEDLKLPKLNRQEYKEFVKDWNDLICKEVLENKSGYYLPFDFGLLKITKSKPEGDLYTTHSVVTGKGKEYNLHSFGYIYRINLFAYNSLKLSKKLFGKKISSFRSAFRFKPHRQNLKRPLAQIIKNNIRDYDKFKTF